MTDVSVVPRCSCLKSVFTNKSLEIANTAKMRGNILNLELKKNLYKFKYQYNENNIYIFFFFFFVRGEFVQGDF